METISAAHRQLLASYRMPAEWETHLATYLVWPHNRATWPNKFEPVPAAFARIAVALSECEPVRILVKDASAADEVRRILDAASARMDRIELLHISTNDSWVRDYGPIFVNRLDSNSGARQIALDWRFNSWGEKWGAYDLDDVVPKRLSERFGFEVIEPGIILEGGSIEVNGAGVLLTTESCLLNPNRNPKLNRAEIENHLRSYLGVTRVLWLGEGIVGDDTDGHVDDLARFVNRDTIVTVVESDPADENYRPLQDNLQRLRAMRDQDGRAFKIETLPMPQPVSFEDARLPASYANFYIANRAVLMPTFDCAADDQAAATLGRLFPGREIKRIPCSDLVLGLGAIHCLTQQHPAHS